MFPSGSHRSPLRHLATVVRVLALASCAGCVYLPLGKIPKVNVANLANGSGAVEVTTRILPGGYYSPDMISVQSVIEPYTDADVKRLIVKVYRVSGMTETPVLGLSDVGAQLQIDLSGAEVARPLRFTNLATYTLYRLRAFAYKAEAGDDANLINDVKASSSVDFRTSGVDRTVTAELKVKLVPKFFDGQGPGPIAVKPGSVRNKGAEVFE